MKNGFIKVTVEQVQSSNIPYWINYVGLTGPHTNNKNVINTSLDYYMRKVDVYNYTCKLKDIM